MICFVEAIKEETPDVRTYRLKFKDQQKNTNFAWLPGQFVQFSLFGSGECTFCIASSPTRKGSFECSIKKVGTVTSDIHDLLDEGREIGIRGPYGNSFPIEELKKKNLLFIGGGIGIAPLRSLIQYVLDSRSDYCDITLLYGARTPIDIMYKNEIEDWEKKHSVKVILTVDKADEKWNKCIGHVPSVLENIVKPQIENTKVITCGPPVMIKFTIQSLIKMGFQPREIITTLEMKMQCGIGKCGHCNIGSMYICKDGPVFNCEQLKSFPGVY
ncbi:MAG: FAD/NAD(P)-binding protein [Candidatus Riflebacteria bacterium]|nr:FAD/NAD(P)-binding protein [Candidatus Riflebacteria bacterium]